MKLIDQVMKFCEARKTIVHQNIQKSMGVLQESSLIPVFSVHFR